MTYCNRSSHLLLVHWTALSYIFSCIWRQFPRHSHNTHCLMPWWCQRQIYILCSAVTGLHSKLSILFPIFCWILSLLPNGVGKFWRLLSLLFLFSWNKTILKWKVMYISPLWVMFDSCSCLIMISHRVHILELFQFDSVKQTSHVFFRY